jgi:glutaredoxin-dependent peroxiredoxin
MKLGVSFNDLTSNMKIEPGSIAPSFSLYDSEKNKISLSDYRGKNVLLLFFPLAFTSVCTKELCSVRDNISVYNQANATVLGISVDSLYALAKFKEEQQINFKLLSDFNKDVSSSYGVLYEKFSYDMKGVSKRSAFVINGNGIIQNAEILEKASDLPNLEAISYLLLHF